MYFAEQEDTTKVSDQHSALSSYLPGALVHIRCQLLTVKKKECKSHNVKYGRQLYTLTNY